MLALAAVSSHTHMHLPCILVSFSGSQPLARTLSLTLAHTGNQWAVSILQRWRGEVERGSESVRMRGEKQLEEEEKRREGMEEPEDAPKQILKLSVWHCVSIYEFGVKFVCM